MEDDLNFLSERQSQIFVKMEYSLIFKILVKKMICLLSSYKQFVILTLSDEEEINSSKSNWKCLSIFSNNKKQLGQIFIKLILVCFTFFLCLFGFKICPVLSKVYFFIKNSIMIKYFVSLLCLMSWGRNHSRNSLWHNLLLGF